MMVLMFGAGLCLLPLLLRLAVRLRLGIPLLFAVLMLTVFRGWYGAHTALADGIFLALIGLAVLSWLVTLLGKAAGLVCHLLDERAAAQLAARRVREARARGESAVRLDDLWL